MAGSPGEKDIDRIRGRDFGTIKREIQQRGFAQAKPEDGRSAGGDGDIPVIVQHIEGERVKTFGQGKGTEVLGFGITGKGKVIGRKPWSQVVTIKGQGDTTVKVNGFLHEPVTGGKGEAVTVEYQADFDRVVREIEVSRVNPELEVRTAVGGEPLKIGGIGWREDKLGTYRIDLGKGGTGRNYEKEENQTTEATRKDIVPGMCFEES